MQQIIYNVAKKIIDVNNWLPYLIQNISRRMALRYHTIPNVSLQYTNSLALGISTASLQEHNAIFQVICKKFSITPGLPVLTTIPELQKAIDDCKIIIGKQVASTVVLDCCVFALNIMDIMITHSLISKAALLADMKEEHIKFKEKFADWELLLDKLAMSHLTREQKMHVKILIANEQKYITEYLGNIKVTITQLKGEKRFKRFLICTSALLALTGVDSINSVWKCMGTMDKIIMGSAILVAYPIIFYYQIALLIDIDTYLSNLKFRRLELSELNILSCETNEAMWNRNKCGDELVISDSLDGGMDVIVERKKSGACQSVISFTPLTYFRVVITEREMKSNVMIGFANRNNHNISGSNSKTCAWHISALTGGLYSQNGDDNKTYALPIQNNVLIEAFYDNNNHTISFKIDNIDIGIAFCYPNIESELYATVDISDPAIITFV